MATRDHSGYRVEFVFILCLLMTPIQAITASESIDTVYESACQIDSELMFNGSLANDSVGWQIALGPRVPNSQASANFVTNVSEVLQQIGWEVTTREHQRGFWKLTNIIATYEQEGIQAMPHIVLSAHYDSRHTADAEQNTTEFAVPGANDGASGVAVLLELARVIPMLELNSRITLLLTDGEDQGNQSIGYTLGAQAWSENLTTSEAESIDSFILLDMVGDASLELNQILPGNETLYQRVLSISRALGYVEGVKDCSGAWGDGTVNFDTKVAVLDDHIHPIGLGIPSIDLMDPVYGEAKIGTFGTYWHTTNDTEDKITAESLNVSGRIIEVALRIDAFTNLHVDTLVEKTNSTTINSTIPEVSSPRHYWLATLSIISLVSIITALILLEISTKKRMRG